MLCGIAVDFGCRRLKYLYFEPFGQAEHIDGSVNIDLRGLNRIVLVVDGRGRAGKIINLIHFYE